MVAHDLLYSEDMDPAIAEKIEKFFSQYQIHQYHKGQILIHAHDEPQHVFYLVSGKVKQYDISYRGDEVVLNIFKPPAFFPMAYAMNKTVNHYFFEAEADVELRLAPIDEAISFIKANPDVLYNLLSRVYSGMDGLLGRLAHLMAGSARSRVMFELLIECRRFGTPDGSRVVVSLTETDIGTHAGLARETVSREVRKLKEEGLISLTKNTIVVNDLERLAASVSHEL